MMRNRDKDIRKRGESGGREAVVEGEARTSTRRRGDGEVTRRGPRVGRLSAYWRIDRFARDEGQDEGAGLVFLRVAEEAKGAEAGIAPLSGTEGVGLFDGTKPI
jgi:hypothetical protein